MGPNTRSRRAPPLSSSFDGRSNWSPGRARRSRPRPTRGVRLDALEDDLRRLEARVGRGRGRDRGAGARPRRRRARVRGSGRTCVARSRRIVGGSRRSVRPIGPRWTRSAARSSHTIANAPGSRSRSRQVDDRRTSGRGRARGARRRGGTARRVDRAAVRTAGRARTRTARPVRQGRRARGGHPPPRAAPRRAPGAPRRSRGDRRISLPRRPRGSLARAARRHGPSG